MNDTACSASCSGWPVSAAGVFGALGVALGAFGAHALRDALAASGHTGTWETAVLYHLVHALALAAVGVGAAAGVLAARPARVAAWAFALGIVLFSGSLYGLSLGGPRLLGPVTPLGGVAFIVGWCSLAFAARAARGARK